MTAPLAEWRLPTPSTLGERRLQCHVPGDLHVAAVIPDDVIALCSGCWKLMHRACWRSTHGLLLCAPCHNQHHGWPS